MGCVRAYVLCVLHNEYWDLAGDADCAVSGAGCVRREIWGSGPIYRDVTELTKGEQERAHDLGKRVRDSGKRESLPFDEAVDVADEVHDFLIDVVRSQGTDFAPPPDARESAKSD